MKLTPGVYFTKVLLAALADADPKSAKSHTDEFLHFYDLHT